MVILTNAQIIFNESVALMEKGIIGNTGHVLIVENKDGSKVPMPEPEPIHTFSGWKTLGFQVQKGQKAIATFPIWKHKPPGKSKDKDTGEEVEHGEQMFMTKAFFFKKSQTLPMEE